MKVSAKRTRLFVAIVALTGILLAVPVVAQDVIKIGAIYSFTGPVAEVAKRPEKRHRNGRKGSE